MFFEAIMNAMSMSLKAVWRSVVTIIPTKHSRCTVYVLTRHKHCWQKWILLQPVFTKKTLVTQSVTTKLYSHINTTANENYTLNKTGLTTIIMQFSKIRTTLILIFKLHIHTNYCISLEWSPKGCIQPVWKKTWKLVMVHFMCLIHKWNKIIVCDFNSSTRIYNYCLLISSCRYLIMS